MEEERRAVKPGKLRPFDEYHVITVPRYKTSRASGDEWRTSHSLLFYNKGQLIGRYDGYDIDGNESIRDCFKQCVTGAELYMIGSGDVCDQEGCHAPSTVTYKLKGIFSPDRNVKYDPYAEDKRPVVRKFCDLHSTRGDCDREDADDNYELLKGKGPTKPRSELISKSLSIYLY